MSAAVSLTTRLWTTVGRELLVAVTGLGLVLFVIGHLAGNLFIYVGPEALNRYAETLASLGELLWVIRLGLITIAVVHIVLAAQLTLANLGKRDRYAVSASVGRKTIASRFMIYSGIIVFLFIFLHLYDFTLAEKEGAHTVVPLFGAEELGLFGVVWNAFANPLHALVYVIAVACVGLHLSHAISSVVVTLGILTDRATPNADRIAWVIGAVVALGFASIPIYVLIRTHVIGAGGQV